MTITPSLWPMPGRRPLISVRITTVPRRLPAEDRRSLHVVSDIRVALRRRDARSTGRDWLRRLSARGGQHAEDERHDLPSARQPGYQHRKGIIAVLGSLRPGGRPFPFVLFPLLCPLSFALCP